MNKKIIISIIFISFVQMATNGISSILADIQNAFPSYSSSSIQFLMTFPSFFIIIFSFIAAHLSNYLSKRKLIIIGLSLVIIAGTISFVGHKSFVLLMVGASILGAGVGLCSSFAISLISEYFNEPEKSKIMGIQTAAANFGSMLMTFLGGFLAKNGWKYNYLVYLLALPGIICSFLYLDDNVLKNDDKGNIKECNYTFGICIEILLFMIFFYIGPTSIAMLFNEKNISSTSIIGAGTTLFLFGGALCSLLFGRLNNLLKDRCVAFGFLCLAIGFLLMTNNNLLISLLGCFVAGNSIGIVMPKYMMKISENEKPNNVTIATAIAMASSNVGTFIAPIYTMVCANLFNISTVSRRVIVAGLICLIVFIIKSITEGSKNGK